MKRIIIALIIGLALVSMLCVALVFALAFTPLRSGVAKVVDRVAERIDLNLPWERQRSSEAQEPAFPYPAEETGILVAGVLPGSPAEAAGLRRGDIILQVNGKEVNSLPELMTALSAVNQGDEVRLQILRGDESRTLTVTAGETTGRQTPFSRIHGGLLGIIPSAGFGLSGGFSVDPTQGGARITNVAAGSPAEAAGLQTGERIVAVNGEAIAGSSDLVSRVRQFQPGAVVTLTVEGADGEQRDVQVTLAENPDAEGQTWLGVYLAAGAEGSLENQPNLPFNRDDRNEQPFETPQLPAGVERGAVLMAVVEGGPAAQAGLKSGEVIVAVDGETLTSADQLKEYIAARSPGDEITLAVLSGGSTQTHDVQVTLGENPDQPGAAYLGIRFAFAEPFPKTYRTVR